MRKKAFILSAIVLMTISFSYQFKIKHLSAKNNLSDLALENIEALANNESSGDNKYSYEVWQNEDCYIYVGGAYAKGKKVSCYSGNEHPICVDCKL